MKRFARGRSAFAVAAAALLGVALTFRLGVWQLDRAADKRQTQATLDARSLLPPVAPAALAADEAGAQAQHDRRVRLRGRWLPRFTVFLDNRQMDGRTGFYVVTPLLLHPPSDAVLVQRGWVPRNQLDRSLLPAIETPADEVEVAGLIAPPPSRLYEFTSVSSGPIRQNIDLQGFGAESGLHLRPLSLKQTDPPSAAGDGLVRHWPAPALGLEKHYGYAFQWFAMAALMAGLYVWFQLVRPRLRRVPSAADEALSR